MEKYIYDNSNGLWYELQGDYYIPCLVLPDTKERLIGIWGRKHLDYINEHRPVLYVDLLLSSKLHSYLADIDVPGKRQARPADKADGTERRHQRTAESTGSDGMGQSHEQYPQSCRRNRPQRTDLLGGCRMRILEKFWYGNIEPTEYDTSSCKEYKKLLELICQNEEKLQATMTDKQKKLFSRYTDAVREHQMITDCLIFQNGFKLGARMMLEVMEEYQRSAGQ